MANESNTIPDLEPVQADAPMDGTDTADGGQPMDTSESKTIENEEPPRPQYQIDVLQYIKKAQAQNGLRHGDYQRYRQYCTRRLRRIRKSTGFLHSRKRWVSKTLLVENVKDERFLFIPLVNAERSWAYAMELKEEINLHQTEHHGEINTRSKRRRFHLIRKLKKAAGWGQQLEDLCLECANPKTQLEVEAYSNFLHGTLYLEQGKHSQALPKLKHAGNVYEQLGKVSDFENEALCNERVASLQQSTRFCEYMVTRERKRAGLQDSTIDQGKDDGKGHILQSKLDQVLAESALEEGQTDSWQFIKWQGQKIGIKNEKLRMRFATARELEKQMNEQQVPDGSELDEAKQALFSKIFSSYDDALRMVSSDLRDAITSKSTNAPSLESLRNYIIYQKHVFNTQRNLMLAKNLQCTYKAQDANRAQEKRQKKVKPDDLVNMYDKIIQSIGAQGKLNNKIVEKRNLAIICHYKALRCFYVAESYRQFNKLGEAYVMYSRAVDLTAEAIVSCRKCKTDLDMENRIKEVQEISKEANAKQYVVRATAYLTKEMQSNELKSGMNKVTLEDKRSAHVSKLVDRLEQFETGQPERAYDLVSFPPNFQAVPCKPILFDLARNTIQPNDISHRIKSKGLLNRLWGR